MGIFSSIKEKLFGKAAETTDVESAPTRTVLANDVQTKAAGVIATPDLDSEVAATLAGANAEPASLRQTAPVDLAAILDEAVKKYAEKLDWRHSIVDLLKALGLEASLAERKELADELGYTGEKTDSATMNTWLHKALLKALSENGGKVPADLLD
ncbi:DUF3597 domain-containing protein [Sinorhizobium sp. RAC02]|uniref:DUF3597 domain-containing protein n=1 Tax=Sinorhizobium sp. RAC02 TaxID=1842534 RepID=UPI00083E683B|nr:DUF3597 domain-containing protein [Sinorhizobium sp. RAC02]AOF92495.1 hypothetical protein BSY16_4643 [Sinorhizobium sp. RAC02]